MKRIAVALSILLNATIVAALLWAWFGGGQGFLLNAFIQPAHLRWVSQFEVLGVLPGDTVFLGNSITEGGSWHELFPETNVRNRGIGGDVTTGVLARIDQVRLGQPAQVFLLIGTNDLSIGISEADIVANIGRIVDEIHAASPQTNVFVQSVLPRAAEYRERIESLNRVLAQAVAGRALWVNLYPLFLDEQDGSIADAFSNDELHLLGAGYAVWRDAIETLVNRG